MVPLVMLGLPLLLLSLLEGTAPPLMMEEMAAASTAVKFGSAVMAAVAALTVSANDGCGGWPGCAGLGGWRANWVEEEDDDPIS